MEWPTEIQPDDCCPFRQQQTHDPASSSEQMHLQQASISHGPPDRTIVTAPSGHDPKEQRILHRRPGSEQRPWQKSGSGGSRVSISMEQRPHHGSRAVFLQMQPISLIDRSRRGDRRLASSYLQCQFSSGRHHLANVDGIIGSIPTRSRLHLISTTSINANHCPKISVDSTTSSSEQNSHRARYPVGITGKHQQYANTIISAVHSKAKNA
ncbi:hypothetical protein ACLOJK_004589 [Asimina triloba]